MDAPRVLSARIAALQRDLDLATLALGSDALRVDLRASVHDLFNGFFQRKQGDLAALADDVGKVTDGPGALAACWTRFDAEAAECERLVKAYLAFLEGALVRSARLDRGICDVADAFLKQLARVTVTEWSRFTIVSDGEFYAPLTDIIQLRYPHFSVWNLPVLAHEFGHYVTPRLMDRLAGTNPLAEYRREVRKSFESRFPAGVRERESASIVAQLDEFIADTFATYTTGPAFACASLLLHFDPAHADDDPPEHPSDDRRAYVLLAMLEQRPEYRKIADMLRLVWESSLRAAGRQPMAATDRFLDDIARRMADIWERIAPSAKLSSDDWARAAALSSARLAAAPEMRLATPRDILNAAWLCRLSATEAEVPALNESALACFAHFGHVAFEQRKPSIPEG